MGLETNRLLRRLACILFLTDLVSGAPAIAAPRLFGLFVGVAEYQYSSNHNPRGSFEDLGGAPNDIAAMKETIAPRIAFANSITLLNDQATRAGIIAAFDRIVAEASAGDTLLFYYTGHGGRIVDVTGQQLSGYSSTIVPYDARNPDRLGDQPGDIVDNELRKMIEAASGAGINVITIFDSCNSGTATRAPSPWVDDKIRYRSTPEVILTGPLKAPESPLVLPAVEPVAPRDKGYVVHLAAAPDGKAAIERMIGGQWRGDFTEALIRSLNELPANSTYRDLLDSVRAKLRQKLRDGETDRAMTDIRGEGALDQTFLGTWNPVRLIEGKPNADGTWQLAAGSIAGMTSGSRFAGFASGSEARSEGAIPIASAVIAELAPGSATLALEGPLIAGDTTPGKLFWRETAHVNGETRLRLKVSKGSEQALASVKAQIEGLAIDLNTGEIPDLGLDLSSPGTIRVARAEDDSTLTTIPANDTARLREVLEQVTRYHSLLALVGQGTPLDVEFKVSDTYCDGTRINPLRFVNGEAHLKAGQDSFVVSIRNNEPRVLYPHIIILSSDYQIDVPAIQTGDNAKAEGLEPGKCWNDSAAVGGSGRDYMLLVMADRPLPGLEMLQSARIRGDAPEITDPLTALMGNAMHGLRSRGSAPPGEWSIQSVSYLIEGDQ